MDTAAIKSGQAPIIDYMSTEPAVTVQDSQPRIKRPHSPRVTCVVCGKLGTKFYKNRNGNRELYFEHVDENTHRAPSGRLMGKVCRAGILQDTSGLDSILGVEQVTTQKPSKWGRPGHCDGCNRDNMALRYRSKVIKKGRLCVTCYAKERKNLKAQKDRKQTPDPLNKTADKKPGPKARRRVGRPKTDYKKRFLAIKKRYDRLVTLVNKPLD
jgi:hypothetical protein